MSILSYRFNKVETTSAAGNLQPASSYTVVAYAAGAQVTSVAGATITVRAGHGFANGQKCMVNTDTTKYAVVSNVAATQLDTSPALVVVAGDYLVNLGADGGLTSPDFDGSSATIYSDMDGTTAVTESTLTTNSDGEYGYWYPGNTIWELILSGSTPLQLLPNAEAGRLLLDYDGDNTAEFRIGEVSQWGAWASDNRVAVALQDTLDAANPPDVVTTMVRMLTTYTGNASVPHWREGAFFIQRHGVSGSGGANTSSSGSNIAVGAYNEHRGDGTIAGPIYGMEAAVTMYNTGTLSGSVIGALCSTQVYNSGVSPAVITTAIGCRGDVGVTSGQGTITNMYGVEGLTKQNGTGTITNAYCFRATASKSGGGTITNQYGLRVPAMTYGGTNNYGIYLDGASGGSGTNQALHVDSGTSYFGGTVQLAAALQLNATSVNVTGNDVIDTTGVGLINLTNVSGTNTITLEGATGNGFVLILRCAALTAGTLTLADSGTAALNTAWVPDANDTLTLISTGSTWYELARSAN